MRTAPILVAPSSTAMRQWPVPSAGYGPMSSVVVPADFPIRCSTVMVAGRRERSPVSIVIYGRPSVHWVIIVSVVSVIR